MDKCFWCDRIGCGLLTNDHVVPKALGGEFYGNVVPACPICQKERGDVTCFYCRLRKLKTKLLKWDQCDGNRKQLLLRYANRMRQRHYEEVLLLVEKWSVIEKERWGSSPIAEWDMTFPELPALTEAPVSIADSS